MQVPIKEQSAQDLREIELADHLHTFTQSRQYLRTFLWDAAADGHNTNHPDKDCDGCLLALEVLEALRG